MLKAKCKRCERRHLDVLHEVNANADGMSKGNNQTSEKGPVSPASQTLYLDWPTSGKQVLLKLSRVIIRNGDKSLETYAVLDDGSEHTILLNEAARRLDLQGEIEDLGVHTIHGRSVSFSIAPV